MVGKGKDYEIIRDKIQGDKGHFLWEELWTMVLLIMLLFHVRLFAQRIGASIAGGSPYISVIGLQYANFFMPDGRGSSNIFTKVGEFIGGSIQSLQVQYIPNVMSKIARNMPGVALVRAGIEKASNTSVGKGVAVVGKGVSSAYNIAEWTVGAESDLKRHYREKEAFRSITFSASSNWTNFI